MIWITSACFALVDGERVLLEPGRDYVLAADVAEAVVLAERGAYMNKSDVPEALAPAAQRYTAQGAVFEAAMQQRRRLQRARVPAKPRPWWDLMGSAR